MGMGKNKRTVQNHKLNKQRTVLFMKEFKYVKKLAVFIWVFAFALVLLAGCYPNQQLSEPSKPAEMDTASSMTAAPTPSAVETAPPTSASPNPPEAGSDSVILVDRSTIHINELSGEPPYLISSVGGLIEKDVFVSMTKKELFDYCGYSFDVAKVFDKAILSTNSRIGINQTLGGDTYVQSSFSYLVESARINIVLLPTGFLGTIGYDASNYQVIDSEINEVEMNILHFPSKENYDLYFTKFSFTEIGIAVYARDLEEEDFLRLLFYLTSPERQN